ncbi:MAG TPA: outer membrane protein transport protein, partial [Candidatus Deferrimicrobiaceae bacterium]
MRGWRGLAVLLVLLLSASTSFAAGFRLPEAGNKANAMGFAFTAQADNPSAIYYNPAGLTQLERNNIALGVTYVKENGNEFTGSTPLTGATPASPGLSTSETQEDLNFFLPNLYYTYSGKGSGIAYGLGVFTPFGLGQEYKNPDTSIFRNQVTKVEIQTAVVNPTIAFDINEVLSVGFGVDFLWGNVEYKTTPVLGPGVQFKTKLEGDGTAWGYNGGILLKPTKNLKIGANFRSGYKLEIKDADFTASDPVGTVPLPMGTTKAYGTLRLPSTAAFGASYDFGRLTIEADLDWTFWSSFQELRITNVSVPQYTVVRAQNWEDVMAFRAGLEYRVTDPIALRVGYSYDPTPVPAETLSPLLPDSDRNYYTAGAGFKFGNWTIDISGIYIDKKDRNVSNIRAENSPTGAPNAGQNGEWKGDAW